MGTRGVYTFKEKGATFHVYSHWDNYPTGGAQKLHATVNSDKVWKLPRYEADEFAAAFIAVNKTDGGNIRLLKGRASAVDVEYGYTIWPDPKTHQLMLQVSATDFWGPKPVERSLWKGLLTNFTEEVAGTLE